jgi:hypothetical protein
MHAVYNNDVGMHDLLSRRQGDTLMDAVFFIDYRKKSTCSCPVKVDIQVGYARVFALIVTSVMFTSHYLVADWFYVRRHRWVLKCQLICFKFIDVIYLLQLNSMKPIVAIFIPIHTCIYLL